MTEAINRTSRLVWHPSKLTSLTSYILLQSPCSFISDVLYLIVISRWHMARANQFPKKSYRKGFEHENLRLMSTNLSKTFMMTLKVKYAWVF